MKFPMITKSKRGA